MPKSPRKKTLNPPRSVWETTLEESDGSDRSQAGEIEVGEERGGGGDKGFDAETGDGGYGGDAALAGEEESAAQSLRPVDREVHGDPRTHEGESYPNDAKTRDEHQGPWGRQVDLESDGEDPDAV
jgi:hypothetical protein